ncbi:hypothetical protein CAEBREN_06237 [Caenorhabditis brenneri]|uniref:RING-type domain-containing protein n=1 Tax=Caenorhabditis brenneri TaxID=135651 RepID=G0MAJ8_CAEBE|nr:hypothetical protein CAEBREN_06237 [Caenorhabditis brenneri]
MSSSPLVTDTALRFAESEKKKAEHKLKLQEEEIARIMKEIEEEENALKNAKKKDKTQKEKAKGVTDCVLCCNPYDHQLVSNHVPYQFECGHTFCKTCVKKMFHDKNMAASKNERKGPMRIECPLCREIEYLENPNHLYPEYQIMNHTLRSLLRLV